MKVKDFKFALMAFVMMFVGMSFVACSEDDDDPEPKKSLVGTWEWDDEYTEDGEKVKMLQRYVFNADLTGNFYEKVTYVTTVGSKEENMSFEGNEKSTYIYDNEDDELILNFKEEGTYRTFDVMGISAKELMLEDSDGDVYYFEKK